MAISVHVDEIDSEHVVNNPSAALTTNAEEQKSRPTASRFSRFMKKAFHKVFIESHAIFYEEWLNKIITFALISLSVWLAAFVLFKKEALPGGILFSLYVLVTCSHTIGHLFELIKLPSLLGIDRFILCAIGSDS
jgi:hypothetical protein